MSNIYLNGSIGYTLLIKNNIKILILADMHSNLPYCKKDGIFISDWFKNKYNSRILLEEVPRVGPVLKELWPSSPHTQKLKEEYIKNSHIIQGVDIRPLLIPFSWELVYDDYTPSVKLKEYLELINLFFTLKLDFIKNDLKHIYSEKFLKKKKLGKHFLILKKIIIRLIKKNKIYLDKDIKDVIKDNKKLLEQINNILSDIMEWYIIAKIYQGINENKNYQGINENKTSFIIHAGLAHTTNIINLLKNYYNYKVINDFGRTNMHNLNIESTGCLHLPIDIENQFGGFLVNKIKNLYFNI
jgi:hypothetical protein